MNAKLVDVVDVILFPTKVQMVLKAGDCYVV